ncbi:MAG TPA: hypothetical protein DEO84_03195 [candidate division Zixibacteria bacterium]|nr:hypothetical protein [candidate division Zixibacteria bacterium]
MRCENCGTDNNFDWATFCRNCQQPLHAEVKAGVAAESQFDATCKTDNSEQDMEIEATEVSDKSESATSDPMDFILGAKKAVAPSGSVDPMDAIRPEPIEHELTLYRDQDVKLSLTESEQKAQVTVETLKDNIKIMTEHIPVEDEPVEESPEDQESSVVALETPAEANKTSAIKIDVVPEASSEQEELAHKTDKIQIEPPASQPEVTLGFDQTGEPIIPKPVLNEIKQSRGVIYYNGKNLTLTGGAKISTADEIRINDKAYDIKPHPGRSKMFFVGIIGAGAVLILIALALFTLSSKDIGQLVGTISSGADGRPLIGQGIKIAELNKTVSTNEAGFFVFSDLPAGIYTIEMKGPSGGKVQDRISVVKNQTTTIALRDSKPVENTYIPQTVSQTETKQVEISKPESKATGKGGIRLTLSPPNSSAFVDDSPLGVGSNSYKLDPGTYTLTVKKDGYEDYRQQIRVDADKVQSLKISLQQSNQASSRTKTDSESALEQETAGNYPEAIRLYDRVLDKNARDTNALLGKARCARAEGALDDAMTYYMQAAKFASDKGDANSQLLALSGVIEMRPNTFIAYNTRGDLLYTLGQYDKAADDYAHVIEVDNRNLGAYYKLGDCYYKSAKYTDALHAFAAAQELNFADPKASAKMTKTFLAMGDKKNAKKAYENFKEIASYSTRLEYKRDPEWQKVLAALGEKE